MAISFKKNRKTEEISGVPKAKTEEPAAAPASPAVEVPAEKSRSKKDKPKAEAAPSTTHAPSPALPPAEKSGQTAPTTAAATDVPQTVQEAPVPAWNPSTADTSAASKSSLNPHCVAFVPRGAQPSAPQVPFLHPSAGTPIRVGNPPLQPHHHHHHFHVHVNHHHHHHHHHHHTHAFHGHHMQQHHGGSAQHMHQHDQYMAQMCHAMHAHHHMMQQMAGAANMQQLLGGPPAYGGPDVYYEYDEDVEDGEIVVDEDGGMQSMYELDPDAYDNSKDNKIFENDDDDLNSDEEAWVLEQMMRDEAATGIRH